MQYPLLITFKTLSLVQQFRVTDASERTLLYVKQQMFKLKENIKVFEDEAQTNLLYEIRADRIIDFSANYRIVATNGQTIGAIKRKGMRSLWKAHYEITDSNERHVYTVREANVWTKVLNGLLGEVPVVGMFTGYFLNPAYIIARTDGTDVWRVQKKPAFFEGRFAIEQLAPSNEEESRLALLSAMMMLVLERSRG